MSYKFSPLQSGTLCSFDNYEVAVDIFGPKEVRKKNELSNRVYFDMTIRAKCLQHVVITSFSRFINKVLDHTVAIFHYPRSSISIDVHVLEYPDPVNSQTLLALMLNAIQTALIIAGVPMKMYFTASMLHFEGELGKSYMAVYAHQEEKNLSASITEHCELLFIKGSDKMDISLFNKDMLNLSRLSARKIWGEVKGLVFKGGASSE